MTWPAYHVEWNGEEYVARADGIDDVSGHSRIALYAMQALVRKLRELGVIDQDGRRLGHDRGERKA